MTVAHRCGLRRGRVAVTGAAALGRRKTTAWRSPWRPASASPCLRRRRGAPGVGLGEAAAGVAGAMAPLAPWRAWTTRYPARATATSNCDCCDDPALRRFCGDTGAPSTTGHWIAGGEARPKDRGCRSACTLRVVEPRSIRNPQREGMSRRGGWCGGTGARVVAGIRLRRPRSAARSRLCAPRDPLALYGLARLHACGAARASCGLAADRRRLARAWRSRSPRASWPNVHGPCACSALAPGVLVRGVLVGIFAVAPALRSAQLGAHRPAPRTSGAAALGAGVPPCALNGLANAWVPLDVIVAWLMAMGLWPPAASSTTSASESCSASISRRKRTLVLGSPDALRRLCRPGAAVHRARRST